MVTFDLSELKNRTGLGSKQKDILDLLYQIGLQTSAYVQVVPNLRTGKRPDEGQLLSTLATSQLIDSVRNTIMHEQQLSDMYMSNLYTDTTFQALVASGLVPVAWLYNNRSKTAAGELTELRNIWDAIASEYLGVTKYRGFQLYSKIKSFGMLTLKMLGHNQEHLMWYVIPNTNNDKEDIEFWMAEHHIKGMLVMTDTELAEHLIDEMYSFLFRFDKTMNVYSGTSFVLTTEFRKVVPTYLVKIGCDKASHFTKDNYGRYHIASNRYRTIDIRKGEVVKTGISIPNNHVIAMVAINGEPYYVGTQNFVDAGIVITEVDSSIINGYNNYEISIAGIMEPSTIYINTCEDLTGRGMGKSMISTLKSTIRVSEDDVTLHLIFTKPFIYLNTDKITLYALKTDNSDCEVIESKQIIWEGYRYVERKVVFAQSRIPEVSNSFVYELPPDLEESSDNIGTNNPYVIFYKKPSYGKNNAVVEPNPEARAICYGVAECGSIIISFDGFTDYKYFMVSFGDRAMISTYRFDNDTYDVDVIPVIENFIAKNPNINDPDLTPEDPDKEPNPDDTGKEPDPVPPTEGTGDGTDGGSTGDVTVTPETPDDSATTTTPETKPEITETTDPVNP